MSRRRGAGDKYLVHIGDVLGPALERLGPKTLWTEAKLRKVWPAVVGPEVAVHATPGRLKGTTLVVYVTSDTWATEFRYLSEVVKDKLNARLGDGIVTEISVAKRRNQPPS
jgi:predicted nucleic acid-binding Zn ribbon protein